MLLHVDGLGIRRRGSERGRSLVRGVSFDLARGHALGVVGESGSGKSLTALSIIGMLPGSLQLDSGRIVYEGNDLTVLSEAQRHAMRGRKIGFVFQDPLSALNPTLTIGRQLIDVLRRHQRLTRPMAFQAAVDGMTAVGIQESAARMHVYPHQLSGGMRQRALIAMALCCRPELLIADEPTTALDVTVQARIIGLLRNIRKSGVAIMFISHNLDLVAEFCDSVLVMYGGRIMEIGRTDYVVRRPRHPYTRALLDCVPRLSSARMALRVIPGQPRANLSDAPGCPFAERCDRVQERCWTHQPPLEPSDEFSSFACWNPVPSKKAVQ